jgi:hypothetical protein
MRRLFLEARLWLCAVLLRWAFDVTPKRGDSAKVWIAIDAAAKALVGVRVAPRTPRAQHGSAPRG